MVRFSDLGWHFCRKMNVPENFCPESLGPVGSDILENVPEPFSKLRNFRSELLYKYTIVILETETLFSTLRIETCPVFGWITLILESVIVNSSYWKFMYSPEVSIINLESFKKLFYLLSTAPTPKIVTIFCMGFFFLFEKAL